jgi:DHA3 family macrolide efflux protein-like MFS transporter
MQAPSERANWKLPFFTIWIGQALSLLGSSAAQFALIWWITQETGSATVLAMASLVGLIPSIVLAPLAGVYVDRWNRRWVMIIADTAIAAASLWLAILFWQDTVSLWQIYVILFLRSLGGSFHGSAMTASTSLMVPEDQLTRVAGINQTLHGLLNIFGAPLGALLMELLQVHGVMMVDVATAVLAVAPLFWVHIPQPERRQALDREAQPSFWADLRDGARYLLNWRGLMIMTGMVMVLKIVLTPAFSLIPLLVKDHFGGGATQLSLLEAVVGGGIVVGGLLLSAWGGFSKKVRTMTLGGVGFGLAILAWGILRGDRFGAAVASGAFLGLAIPLVDGPLMALLQSTIAPEKQGRVFSLFGSLISLTSPIGLALAGPISDRLGLQVWYVVAGTLAVTISAAFILVPPVRNIEQHACQSDLAAQPSEFALAEAD